MTKTKTSADVARAVCEMCGAKIKTKYRLYDAKWQRFGDYCSRPCADDDAWGPRFRPTYHIRRLARRSNDDSSTNA
jgi:hypothetical protein